MTHETILKNTQDLEKGVRMMLDRLEKTKNDTELSLCEMGVIADIVKDMAKANKDIVKAHYLMSEKPIKKY